MVSHEQDYGINATDRTNQSIIVSQESPEYAQEDSEEEEFDEGMILEEFGDATGGERGGKGYGRL